MKLLLDACVLYPTVMREMLIGAAKADLFVPLWSERLLEEWARAARKRDPLQEVQARGEIAVLRSDFPKAEVSYPPTLEARLWLPDPADIHVLAAAIAGSADRIVTLNAKDFPKNILHEEGLTRIDPDAVLYQFWLDNADAMDAVGANVLHQAQHLSGRDWDMRALMKKARLPRLGKALGR
ncbi:MAG: PIN domain-containing protein [Aliishimia sp.]